MSDSVVPSHRYKVGDHGDIWKGRSSSEHLSGVRKVKEAIQDADFHVV